MMNKRQAAIVDTYRGSNKTELYHAYHSMSAKKVEAWENCKRVFAEHETRISELRILGANSFQFSAGFEFTDPQDGNIKFCYITKSGVEEWDE